jgi:hypothetical protein
VVPADSAFDGFTGGSHNSERCFDITLSQTFANMFGKLEGIFQILEMLPYHEIFV